MERQSAKLRALLRSKTFLHMPSVYDAIGGRLVQSIGYEAAYIGGYVTGGSTAVTEPLLTMTEQVRLAGDIAQSITIPLVADAGAGFGEPLHTMRTVREFIRNGIAGIHIEDQLYPKRAHYHKYVVHGIPVEDFVEKIKFSCKQRDETDRDFVIIARTDTCRALGLEEASMRINRAADVGADLGLLFPRNPQEAEQAPKVCRVPLVYVQSRGNRDGRRYSHGRNLNRWVTSAVSKHRSYCVPHSTFSKNRLPNCARPVITRASQKLIS
jgi:methylisocitrate lyase